MILKYGSYAHASNEAAVSIQRQNTINQGGIVSGYKETWQISGLLMAADQAALLTAISNLKAAYLLQGQDLGLYLDNGTTLTPHALTSRDSSSGVRVVSGPSFTQSRGYELGTFRNYEITLEAEFQSTDGNQQNLLTWIETVSFQGDGGPEFLLLKTINGRPQKQQIHEATPYMAFQRGSAIGQFQYLPFPPPIWPEAEHRSQRRIDRKTPKRSGPIGAPFYTEFESTWEYVFESERALTGDPTLWPQ